jgi:hypothetical protein
MSAQSPWLLGPPQLQTQSRPSRASAAFLPQPANLSSSTGAAGQDGEAQPSAEVSNGSKVGGTDAEVSSGCRVEQAASQSSVNGIKVVLSGAEVAAVQPPAISSVNGIKVVLSGAEAPPLSPLSPTSRFALFQSASLSKLIHQCRCPLECVCARAYRTRSSGCGVYTHNTHIRKYTDARALIRAHTPACGHILPHARIFKKPQQRGIIRRPPVAGPTATRMDTRTHARTHACTPECAGVRAQGRGR